MRTDNKKNRAKKPFQVFSFQNGSQKRAPQITQWTKQNLKQKHATAT